MTTPEKGKAEKMAYVAEVILKILLQSGLPAVNHSRVSRAAKVSRAWLYKYIGKDPTALCAYATSHFGAIFADFDSERAGRTKENYVEIMLESQERLIEKAEKYPWVLPLYARFSGSSGDLGQVIRDVEERYLSQKTTELGRLYSIERDEARMHAELLLAMRMSLAHRWVVSPPFQKLGKTKIRQALKKWFALLR